MPLHVINISLYGTYCYRSRYVEIKKQLAINKLLFNLRLNPVNCV